MTTKAAAAADDDDDDDDASETGCLLQMEFGDRATTYLFC